MNALVRKEVRLLLPSFSIGLLLALSIWLFPENPSLGLDFDMSLGVLAFMVSPAMLVMMTLGSFGRELSAGTFSFLLSQPVPRSRVWWTKTVILALATGILWAVWWFSLSSTKNFLAIPQEDRNDAFVTAVLFAVVVYSGGLWTTVFFRQLAAAFWFTLLAPAALMMAIASVSHENDPNLKSAIIIALSSYSVAGFVFARWLFLRAQDTHWTGGTVTLPEAWRLTGWFGRRGERRQPRPRAALWAKELQLYQSQFLLAGLLALLHLVVLAVRNWGGDFKNFPALEFVLQHFWVLWTGMPLMVGSAAVAEERQLGTLEGQLCLPSRRGAQFGIKFAGALLLSILLGAMVPLLLEGTRIQPDFSDQIGNPSNYAITTPGGTMIPMGDFVATFWTTMSYLMLPGIALVIAVLSFYASTLARTTMQALAPATLCIIATWFLVFAASETERFIHYPLWRGWLVYLVGVPVLMIVLGALTYWNFKRVLVGGNVWRRNALVWVVAFGGITTVTTATYHRVWEHFMTLEPPHGLARLDFSNPVTMRNESSRLAVQFPDGRNWSSQVKFSVPTWTAMFSGDWKVESVPRSVGYLEGTNWLSVARSYRDVIGIQKDGSLWVSERPQKFPWASPPSPATIRLGQDFDWKSFVIHGSLAFLLKTNGTLWRLGTNRNTGKDWPGFRAFAPERAGADSDWANVYFADHGRMGFQKMDGRVWTHPAPYASAELNRETIRLDADTALSRAPYLDGQKSVAWMWPSAFVGRNFVVGLGEDGGLRVIAYWGWQPATNNLPQNWVLFPQQIPLTQDTNWLALADNHEDVVTLKADGSLWKLNFPTDPITRPEGFSAVPFSRHSDWVAITVAMDGMVGLAADGSLWFWAMERRTHYPSWFAPQPLLAASRRPQLLGNIFDSPAP